MSDLPSGADFACASVWAMVFPLAAYHMREARSGLLTTPYTTQTAVALVGGDVWLHFELLRETDEQDGVLHDGDREDEVVDAPHLRHDVAPERGALQLLLVHHLGARDVPKVEKLLDLLAGRLAVHLPQQPLLALVGEQ
eukprot:1632750-Pleurochrysis_carterae.AAC.1